MGSMQINKGVHIAMAMASTSDGIAGKWVVDPFCNGNGNGKNSSNTGANTDILNFIQPI